MKHTYLHRHGLSAILELQIMLLSFLVPTTITDLLKAKNNLKELRVRHINVK